MRANHSMKKNAILNIIKQLCSLLFPLVTVPYISRVLGSEYYGRINWVNSVVSYFALLAGFGVSTYAVREGSRKRDNGNEFSEFSSEVFTINIVTTVISYGLLFITLLFWKKLDTYRYLTFAHSMVIIFTTLGADWINVIFEDYEYITVRYIIVHIIAMGLMLGFVKSSEDYIIYALVSVFSSVGGNLFNIFYIRRYVNLKIKFPHGWRQHIVPMSILLGNSLAIVTYVNMDITLLGIFQSNTDVGIYSVSTKIYTIVKQLINAVIIVSLPRLSMLLGKEKKEKYNELIHMILNILICVLIPAMAGIFMLSDKILRLIAGREYLGGTISLRILCFSLGFAVIACFYQNCIMLPQKMEKKFLKATVAGCICNLVLNFIAIPTLSYNGAALTTLAAEMIVCILCFSYSKADVSIHIDGKSLKTVLSGSAVIVIVCCGCKRLFVSNLSVIISSIMISTALYAIIMKITGNPYFNHVLRMIRKH